LHKVGARLLLLFWVAEKKSGPSLAHREAAARLPSSLKSESAFHNFTSITDKRFTIVLLPVLVVV